MYGSLPLPIPVFAGVSLAATGVRSLLYAEIALVLLISGVVLLRMASMKRRRAALTGPGFTGPSSIGREMTNHLHGGGDEAG